MSDPFVVASVGPFELLADCDYGKHNQFCEKIATGKKRGYNLCDACMCSAGLANLMWEKAQYESCGRPHSMDSLIRTSLERMGKEMATKIGRLDLWNEMMEAN